MSLYKCNFCQDPLQPSPPASAEWLLTFILMRPYTCPHCRESYIRPIVSLANYFGIPKSTSRKSTSTKGWKASPGALRIKPTVEPPKRSSSGTDRTSESKRSSEDRDQRDTESESISNRDKDHSQEPESEQRSRESSHSGSEHRKERSRSSSRSSKQERQHRQLRRRDATISTLSNQSRPSTYRSNNIMARTYRKVRRRVRKMLGLSKSGRRSKSRSSKSHESQSGSSHKPDDNQRSRGSGRSSSQTRLSNGKRSY